MKIYWKALVGYGVVFWIVLCLTDILGISNFHRYKEDLSELYEKPMLIKNIEKRLHLDRMQYKGIKFGWSLLIWNTLTFIISLLMCNVVRSVGLFCWSYYKISKNKAICNKLPSHNLYSKSTSKIPIKVRTLLRNSEINIRPMDKRYRFNLDSSCPNLIKRSESNLSTSTEGTIRTCRTIFKKDIFICNQPELSNEEQMAAQCKKLAQELQLLQTTSLREHAVLSRKLDAVLRERNEQSKHMTLSQKECRAAKQQIQELLQEKTQLVKKLESASREFKSHTKSRKLAMAKLEEATNNLEEMRQELEQVTRDKDILDKKLKLLETEYNRLHERFMATQQKLNNRNSSEDLPEKDDNSSRTKQNYLEDLKPDINTFQQAAEVLVSVSQTELDVKTIQEKIKQLEKNLECLNQDNFECSESMNILASELSLTGIGSDSKDESPAHYSEFSSNSTIGPTGYWSDKVTDLIERNKCQFKKIQDLAIKLRDKAPVFGTRKDKTSSADYTGTTDSESGEPKRLVSSSVAFQNFLKSISHVNDGKGRQSSSNEVYF